MTETEATKKVRLVAILAVLTETEAAKKVRLVAILVVLGLLLLLDPRHQPVWQFPASVFAWILF